MSVAGQGILTGSESADILSQALLQTGVSDGIKLEAENFSFDDNLLSCDVQTLTNDLISKLDDNPTQENMSSTPALGSGAVDSHFDKVQSSVGVSMCNAILDSRDSYSYSGTLPMPRLKNGLNPPQQTGLPLPQPAMYDTGSSTSYGGADVELEELLAIDVDHLDTGMYEAPSNSVAQSYPVPPAINRQTSLPPISQYNSYQSPSSSQGLPELVNKDLLDIFGEEEPNFLDSLMEPSNQCIRNESGLPEDQHHHQQQAGFGGPMSYTPSPTNARPYNIMSSSQMSTATLPPAYSGNSRQFQQPVATNRTYMMQQQMYQKLQGHGRPPTASPNRFPSVPRPFQIPGSAAKMATGAPESQDAGDSDDEDDEDFTGADTYANYEPSKVKIGRPHPDPVVESSSLSSVEPPEVYFNPQLPSEVVESGRLSSLQLESVIYACQQHMNILADGSRAGFLVGDGAGVGKGRMVAGIIYQNYLEGRKKAVWLSVSNDLRLDAARDFKDVGAKKIDIYSLNKFHYGKISGKRNGRVRKGVVFATYSSLIGESNSGGKYKTRFDQLVHWLGPRFEGVIVLDECHKAKNLFPSGATKPSKTGLTVLQLQKKLPKARIVYCSATGASEPKNMAYMSRLGIWGKGTQFNTFQDFIKAVERRGVGAMEIVAIDMKLRGMYMARQLSFCGVSFSINEVELTDKFVEAYNASVKLWVETRRLFQEAADTLTYDKTKLKTMWGQFWASHQRFFKYMCIAAKVQETIRLTKKALEEGKCVVIGLQSTGEARTLEQLERSDGELSGFISTTKGVLETLIRRHFPSPTAVPGLAGIDWSLIDNDPTLPRSCRRRRQRKRPVGTREEGMSRDSDSDDDSSDSPERSDSAVESSSDEGERSSEGSGSSSSESDDDDDDNDVNPFGSDFSEPWLQKKKVKAKSRKRPWSPSSSSSNRPQSKKRNFSIKPPPHSSSKKGKTKTGFNSKKLKFEDVPSPGTHSNKSSPPSFLLSGRTPPLDRGSPFSNSPGEDVKGAFGAATGTLGTGGSGLFGGGGGNSHGGMEVGTTGKNLVNAMSSKFTASIPSGLPMGQQSELYQNATVKKMKEELLGKLEVLSPHLPTNTLDELIDGLGGTRCVAEMTGRRGRVVGLPGGGVQYQLRSEQDVSTELLNITEKQRFMDGEKTVAIISEAASSGISLQSDRRAKNQKRRVHMTLELPWSADRAIQQFGRTHRSNQVSAPEYVFLISTLSGEQRFASIVAKRLQSLGALTHGDRRATESRDLSKFNVDTKYGRQALEKILKTIVGAERPNIKMDDYPGDFFEQCRSSLVGVGLFKSSGLGNISIDKDASTMSRFLNRILGLPVQLQNQLFAYFSDTLAAVVQKAKRTGHWDGGILDFGSSGEHVEIVGTEKYSCSEDNVASAELYTIEVERGLSFEEALDKLNVDPCPGEGFYASKRVCNDKRTAVLVKIADPSGKYFLLYRPNTGRNGRMEKMGAILKKYEKVDVPEGKRWWTAQYESSLETCTHAFWQGNCRKMGCSIGLRRKTYFMLAGSVLGVWSHIEEVFNRCSAHNQRMQIIRVKTQHKRLVGILVPKSCVEDMQKALRAVAHQQGTQDNPITL